jgi:uncharacterized membrane protein
MRRVLHTLLSLVWGLWLGGLVMLFIAVQTLFNTFADRRTIAGEAASSIFHVFNYYHLALAAAALLLAFFWWLAGRNGRKLTVFFILALATLAAAYVSGLLTPKLEHLRIEGLTQSDEFRRLHGLSMAVYLIETILVFIAGIALPWAARLSADRPRRTPAALQI